MQNQTFHKPKLHVFQRGEIHFYIDSQAPNWISVDNRGAKILDLIDGERNTDDITNEYARFFHLDQGKAWRDVSTFLGEARRRHMASNEIRKTSEYRGRSQYLKADELKEFWIHLLQTCNLSCSHCLVSSGPKGERGQSTDFLKGLIDQSYELGVRRFYFTGGEPFVRDDIFDLISYITNNKKSELIILTNATLFRGDRLEKIQNFNSDRLKFQISLDGASPEINDPIRGKGVFQNASEGLRAVSSLGFETSLTAVVTKSNLKDLENFPALAKKLSAKSIHLMWLHKRGRIIETDNSYPTTLELLSLTRQVKKSAQELGVIFDNIESLRRRVNGPALVKYDLGNLCWESLCLYIDGKLYPSAAMAGVPELALGDAASTPLQSIWQDSPVAQSFRSATLLNKESVANDPFRFITGGGDMEHSYFFSSNGKAGTVLAEDPYHSLYSELMKDIMADLANKKKNEVNPKTGFTPPQIFHAMGEDAITCSEDALDLLTDNGLPIVKLIHSNCVLSFDVEKPYRIVQQFYGKAAVEPQAELCCPVKYDESEVGHVPKEVIDRFYGCGSPISQANVSTGETVLDLGSGAGIDCFIAAKKVGPDGKVIGVDMTEEMLKVAHENKPIVAQNLGFDVVEFRKGFLEKIPTEDKTVDLITSNCVVNLSPDKKAVFKEIWRVLKDNGRLVIADIVSEVPVPLALQAHKDLWGECISGSLSEEEFMTGLEQAGFYGISLLKKTFWKEVEGQKFYSITVRGFKFEKKTGCSFIGQKAMYLGPYLSVIDEEGHLFPRGQAIDICTDTATKLKGSPYAGQFRLIESHGRQLMIAHLNETSDEQACCNPNSEACC